MIIETDKLECEIILAIQEELEHHSEEFSFSDEEVLDYLKKCFAAKKVLDEQKMIDATILTLHSACEGRFCDYCKDTDFGNEHMEWLYKQMKRINKK